MCDQLCSDFGFSIRRINNGAPAGKKDEYANADAERWFYARRLFEKRQVILPIDGELIKQLSSRRLQYDSKARIQLEPKDAMRARGLSSPDRADAIIGAVTAPLASLNAGAITAEALNGIRFGPPCGGRMLFDSEPLTLIDSPPWFEAGGDWQSCRVCVHGYGKRCFGRLGPKATNGVRSSQRKRN
jgi:hypothetical protein